MSSRLLPTALLKTLSCPGFHGAISSWLPTSYLHHSLFLVASPSSTHHKTMFTRVLSPTFLSSHSTLQAILTSSTRCWRSLQWTSGPGLSLSSRPCTSVVGWASLTALRPPIPNRIHPLQACVYQPFPASHRPETWGALPHSSYQNIHNNVSSSQLVFNVYCQKIIRNMGKVPCTKMFITVLFTTAKSWRQPKCPTVRNVWGYYGTQWNNIQL